MQMQENIKTCSHEIQIKNLHDGAILTFSLILIRGRVYGPINNCSRIIQLHQGQQLLTQNLTNTGEFKFICDVSYACGANQIVPIELNFYSCYTRCLRIFVDTRVLTAYRVQPIYLLCQDEFETTVVRKHCEIIDANLRLIQTLYADRIQEAGFPPLTFTLNDKCRIFRSRITLSETWAADEQFLWRYFGEELLKNQQFSEGFNSKLKIVAFIGCTKYNGAELAATGDFSYSNLKKFLKGHAALGGGDLALFGTAYFYAWPSCVNEITGCLQNKQPLDLTTEPDESNYRRTYGGVYATTLGAVCHEIGHIFDLGHDGGIMGFGFDFPNRVLTVNERTENLPKRIVENTTIAPTTTRPRFTQFQRNSNFLENYREQRKNDGFYFTRNCALILAYHRWFRNNTTTNTTATFIADIQTKNIEFYNQIGIVRSYEKVLKLIEIRSNANSLVKRYYELPDGNTYEFKLPSDDFVTIATTHHLFVMTIDGLCKRLELC